MKRPSICLIASAMSCLILLGGSLFASGRSLVALDSPNTEVMLPEPGQQSSRLVHYGRRDVIDVQAKLRYTTLIVLPEDERILDFVCGDKEYWVVEGVENFAYVKPSKLGAETNLNLITASGNVYSFVLTEVSKQAGAQPDLKLFVELKDTAMLSAMKSDPRFVPAYQIDDFRRQVEIAKEETRKTREKAKARIEEETTQFRSTYPLKLQFGYRFKAAKKPFNVTSIYNDGKFTFIRANPQEVPALYEIKDGKPNLIQFDYHDGTYVVSKVLDRGYLAIGKKKLKFSHED